MGHTMARESVRERERKRERERERERERLEMTESHTCNYTNCCV